MRAAYCVAFALALTALILSWFTPYYGAALIVGALAILLTLATQDHYDYTASHITERNSQ